MARNHGQVLTSVWTDPDFTALDAVVQRLFFFLISQSGLSHAGLLPLRIRPWSTKAADLTPGDLRDQLKVLEAARFVLVDEDTEELLIRTHVKNDGVWRQPKVLLAAGSDAAAIESPRLLEAFLDELARLPEDLMSEAGREALVKVTDRVSARLSAMPRNPSPPVVDTPTDTPAEGYPLTRGGTPSPTPAPATSHEPHPPTAGATAPPPASEAEQADTAQTLIGEWVEHCRKRPPGQTIARVGKHLRELLAEGIDVVDVRAGLAQWHARGLDPSTLPSVVNELMNAAPDRGRRPTGTAVHDLSEQDYSRVRI